MDEISTKALIIGISLFITTVIITIVVFEFTTIRDLYKGVAETDISFDSQFDEFDKYRNSANIFSGLDVKNTSNKYKNNDLVEVCINDPSTGLRCLDTIDEPLISYKDKYISRLEEINNRYRIIFGLHHTAI